MEHECKTEKFIHGVFWNKAFTVSVRFIVYHLWMFGSEVLLLNSSVNAETQVEDYGPQIAVISMV